MQYELDCECGYYVLVEESAAGTTAECRCGRVIEVPSLRQLRQLGGLAAPEIPPEQVVEALLLAKKLPEERHCLLCGEATEATVCCRTECERAIVKQSKPWGEYLLFYFFMGCLGVIIAVIMGRNRPEQEWGKDRIFLLPLRVCDDCRKQLDSPEKIKATLARVPVYRDLLKKYPNALVDVQQA